MGADPIARRRRLRPADVALAGVVLLLGVRLALFAGDFANNSLQMDFSARYAAARSLMAGEDPYTNNLATSIDLWDGVATTRRSRFLYPPSLALLMRPLAMLPYHAAKIVWMLVGLVGVGIAVAIAGKLSHPTVRGRASLVMLGATLGFWPVVTHMERGQFDGVTLALVMGAAALIQGGRRGLAGSALGLAVIVKLNTAYLLPFLLVLGGIRALGTAIVTILLISLASAAVVGPDLEVRYWTQELAYISGIDEYDEPLGPQLPAEVLRGAPRSGDGQRVIIQDRPYDSSRLLFVGNGSAVRPLRRYALSQWPGVAPPVGAVSLLMLLATTIGVGVVLRRERGKRWLEYEGDEALAAWLLALVVVAVTGPLTWSMNAVWLLPTIALLVEDARHGGWSTWTVLGAGGLAVAALPDSALMTADPSMLLQLMRDWKYPMAALLVGGYLLSRLARPPSRPVI